MRLLLVTGKCCVRRRGAGFEGGRKERESICNSEYSSCEPLGTYQADIHSTVYYNARESLEVLGIRSLLTVTLYLHPPPTPDQGAEFVNVTKLYLRKGTGLL